MKKLIIAEKPSVAKTIANVVNATESNDGYLEGNDYVVSWCFGHLLENATPEMYDPNLKKWKMESLPIVPQNWLETEIESSKKQLKVLTKLMNRRDVGSFIEATDAGREGELIFRRVYEYIGTGKPFERLWISSLEASAVREGMKHLQPSGKYDNLYQAALARSRADWLFGINGTRFYTIAGCMGNDKATVGRVQTPTLAMIVARQREIENFKVEKRFAIVADFGGWKLETEKFNDEMKANEALAVVNGRPVMITNVENQKKKTKAPRLFSLTSLQREMNKRFGFTADKTLKIIQSLYERKILSYPRTDSEYITSDMEDTYKRIISNLAAVKGITYSTELSGKVVDDKKVGDHYAVIATELYSRKAASVQLDKDESTIVGCIVQRMFEAIGEPYEYLETKVTGMVDSLEFKGTGHTPVSYGWKNVKKMFHYSSKEDNSETAKEQEEEAISAFPPDIANGKSYVPQQYSMVRRDTKPPAFFTEDTLLGAMERAGAKEMDDDVERKGIGTSATRAEIIEKLVRRKYIYREKKLLKAADEGIHLIDSVADGFKSVSTTVEWENQLLEIEKGRGSLTCDLFCSSIAEELKKLIATAGNDIALKAGPVGKCPWCGGEMTVLRGVARCECGKRIYLRPLWMPKDGSFTKDDLEKLLDGKRVKTKLCSKDGRIFDVFASIDFDRTKQSQYVEWALSFDTHPVTTESGEIGVCPVCGGKMVLDKGVAACPGCGRRLYSGQRWMPDSAAFKMDDMKTLLAGGAVKTKLRAKTGKVYPIMASIDVDKSCGSQYYEWSFEFIDTGKPKGKGSYKPKKN